VITFSIKFNLLKMQYQKAHGEFTQKMNRTRKANDEKSSVL